MNSEDMIKNDVCWLLNAVIDMRTHQRNYFARRMGSDKVKSIQAEKLVDEICNKLKVRGYIRPPNPNQSKMFE